jgi:uncharacterized protein
MLAVGALIFFAATGFMLNNEAIFESEAAESNTVEMTLPPEMLGDVRQETIVSHLRDNCGVTGLLDECVIDEYMIELTFKRPGGRTDIMINRPGGEMEIMTEPPSPVTVLLDLHKGSHTGAIWTVLIDLAAICLFLACITGIFLWLATPKRRILGLIALLIGLLAWCGAYLFCLPK